MKANELRIGNWVDYEKTTHIITAIDSGNYGRSRWIKQSASEPDYEHTFKEIEPIPLTPEILEKAGFYYQELSEGLYFNEMFGYIENGKEGFIMADDMGENSLHYEIKYLHQLQNLYFALTGEELEINF